MSPRALAARLRATTLKPAPRPASTPPPASQLAQHVAAAQAGDETARAALVEALLPRARNLVRYLVRGDDESDDIVQDALVTVLERVASYRGEGRFEHWADGVVMRVALHKLRRLRMRLRRFVSSAPQDLEVHGDRSPGPSLQRYVVRRQVVRALDRLPYNQRHALVLHHVLGMTVAEAAAELGVPQETLHSRLRAGMKNLRRHSRALPALSDREDAR